MEEEGIEVSQWEIVNLEDHMKSIPRAHKRYRHEEERETRPEREWKKQNVSELQNRNPSDVVNKPTISKSPTFGYLHPPESLP